MTGFLINMAILLAAGLGCLIVGALVLNNPPLYAAPGLAKRLATYFTSNIAETRRQHEFPELELRCYRVAPNILFNYVEKAVTLLGWQVLDSDPRAQRLHAVAATSLLKFKDDIRIELQVAECGSELHIRASSRVGRGDLGANTRHILNLLDTLARIT